LTQSIRFRLNGNRWLSDTEDDRNLLWVLRGDLELTGTKYGCGEGFCGACTVARRRRGSAFLPDAARFVQGKSVVTIEGLEHDGHLHPLPTGLHRPRRIPVRLLHVRDAD